MVGVVDGVVDGGVVESGVVDGVVDGGVVDGVVGTKTERKDGQKSIDKINRLRTRDGM